MSRKIRAVHTRHAQDVEGTVYQERAAQSQVYIVAAVCFVGCEVCGAPGIDSQQQQVETREDCLLKMGPLSWPFCLYALRGDELPALDQVVLPPEVCTSHISREACQECNQCNLS